MGTLAVDEPARPDSTGESTAAIAQSRWSAGALDESAHKEGGKVVEGLVGFGDVVS